MNNEFKKSLLIAGMTVMIIENGASFLSTYAAREGAKFAVIPTIISGRENSFKECYSGQVKLRCRLAPVLEPSQGTLALIPSFING